MANLQRHEIGVIYEDSKIRCCTTDFEDELKLVFDVICPSPGRLGRCHLDDDATNGPDVTLPAIPGGRAFLCRTSPHHLRGGRGETMKIECFQDRFRAGQCPDLAGDRHTSGAMKATVPSMS